MAMKALQVYVVRDSVISTSESHDAILKAFKALVETCNDFKGVNSLSLQSGPAVEVNLYPEQEVEGFWFKERGPDVEASPSPFTLELHEFRVEAEVVPTECSLVAFIGEQTMEQYRKHDINYAIECAWSGWDFFEVSEIAEDCDGFIGLYRSTINAAANLPDTGFDSTEVHVNDADNIALLMNINRLSDPL